MIVNYNQFYFAMFSFSTHSIWYFCCFYMRYFLLQKPTHPTYNICVDSAFDALEYFNRRPLGLDGKGESLNEGQTAASEQCSLS